MLKRKANLEVSLIFNPIINAPVIAIPDLEASRSGMAITGALIIGLNIKDTSRFAFLLSIPTILGALGLMVAKGAYSISFSDMLVMLTGFIGSAEPMNPVSITSISLNDIE